MLCCGALEVLLALFYGHFYGPVIIRNLDLIFV
jgi:hypothetical protein